MAKNLQVLTASGSKCRSIFRSPQTIAESLVRFVDHDGAGYLSWDKCRAAVALAISNRPPQETREDIHTFFEIIDEDGDGRITVFELTAWLGKIHVGMSEDDVASLLYRHFGQAKPQVSSDEFHDWVTSLLQIRQAGHG